MKERLRAAARVVLAGLLYALATPWVLRPWFLAHDLFPHIPGAIGVMGDADLYLNVWILSWIAHAALHAPAALFDGNIFHPATNTIAGSENMLAHLPVTAVALAATGSALAMLKAYLLESFVLAGVGMYLYVHHHTRSAAAALFAGAAYTFTPFRAETVPQPQYLGTAYLPLAWLMVDLWLERGRAWSILGIAAAVGLQALACVYVGFFAFVVVPVYAVIRILLAKTSGAERLRAALGVAVGVIGGALVLVPVSLPYLRARAEGMVPDHGIEWIEHFTWPPWLFLTPGAWPRLGVIPVLVVALGVAASAWRWIARRRGVASEAGVVARTRRRLGSPTAALWAVAGTGVLLAAGPYLRLTTELRVPMPYLLLYRLVPGFSSVRVPLRFTIVVAAAIAPLAAFALARATERSPRGVRTAAGFALALACVLTAAPRPHPVMPAGLGPSASPVYRWLAEQPGPGTVLELPASSAGADADDVIGNLRSSRYMVASTLHWRPLVNGYTAYPPPAAGFLAAAIRDLPDPAALALLVDATDLRWIVVHRYPMTAREKERWSASEIPGLKRVATFGSDDVYEVELRATRPWREQIAARSRAHASDTLAGTSTAPLAKACRAAAITALDPPPHMQPIPLPLRIPVTFENRSACTWPGVGVRPEGLVGLRYRWISPTGERGPTSLLAQLVDDVKPGATVHAAIPVAPPRDEPGTWTLEVELVQQGESEPLAITGTAVELRAAPEPKAPREPDAPTL